MNLHLLLLPRDLHGTKYLSAFDDKVIVKPSTVGVTQDRVRPLVSAQIPIVQTLKTIHVSIDLGRCFNI